MHWSAYVPIFKAKLKKKSSVDRIRLYIHCRKHKILEFSGGGGGGGVEEV